MEIDLEFRNKLFVLERIYMMDPVEMKVAWNREKKYGV